MAELSGGYSKRGRYRGAPLTRDLVSALVAGGAVDAAHDAQLVDFLRRCLELNPDERITAPDAIRHDWLRRRGQGPAAAGPGGGGGAAAAGSTARSSVTRGHAAALSDLAKTRH